MNFIAEVPETCGLQTDDRGNLHVATWIARQAKQAATPNFLFHAISTITYNCFFSKINTSRFFLTILSLPEDGTNALSL
jgi:hypothetical protein